MRAVLMLAAQMLIGALSACSRVDYVYGVSDEAETPSAGGDGIGGDGVGGSGEQGEAGGRGGMIVGGPATPSCERGRRRATSDPCGKNGRGSFELLCLGDHWLATCIDPDACQDDQVRNSGRICDEGGPELQRCDAGKWVFDSCGSAETCTEGTVRLGAPCDEQGKLLERCVGGAWQAASECYEPECHQGQEREGSKCGLNGRGRALEHCSGGLFVGSGQCADPDECIDDTVQSALSCERRCEKGRWRSENDCKFCGEVEVDGSFRFEDDASLEALRGVTHIKGDLGIGGVASLDALSDLMCVGSLSIRHSQLEDLHGLEQLRTARRFSLSDNYQLSDLAGLENLQFVESLDVSQNGLRALHFPSEPVVGRQVDVQEFLLTELSGLVFGPEMDEIDVLAPLRSLASLSGLRSVRWATLSNIEVEDLSELGEWVEVDTLTITFSKLKTVAGLKPNSLRVLILDDNPLEDYSAIANTGVSNLAIRGKADALPGMAAAEVDVLTLDHTSLSSLSDLESMAVEHLWMEHNALLTSLKGIPEGVVRLDIAESPIVDLAPLSKLSRLDWVQLESLPITSLEGLSHVSRLSFLELVDLAQLSGLSGLSSLRAVGVLLLKSLPLADLTSLPGPIEVDHLSFANTAATSLAGIDQVRPATSVGLSDNRLLPRCAAEDYRDALLAEPWFDGTVYLSGNGVEECEP